MCNELFGTLKNMDIEILIDLVHKITKKSIPVHGSIEFIFQNGKLFDIIVLDRIRVLKRNN